MVLRVQVPLKITRFIAVTKPAGLISVVCVWNYVFRVRRCLYVDNIVTYAIFNHIYRGFQVEFLHDVVFMRFHGTHT